MTEIDKQNIILQALVLYWDCCVCKKLGWDEECQKHDNKNACCYYVYDHLRDHIHAIDKIKAGEK